MAWPRVAFDEQVRAGGMPLSRTALPRLEAFTVISRVAFAFVTTHLACAGVDAIGITQQCSDAPSCPVAARDASMLRVAFAP